LRHLAGRSRSVPDGQFRVDNFRSAAIAVIDGETYCGTQPAKCGTRNRDQIPGIQSAVANNGRASRSRIAPKFRRNNQGRRAQRPAQAPRKTS